MIYITGDTHGEQARFLNKDLLPEELSTGDYLIICGDFGYIFMNNDSEKQFLDYMETLPYTILFLDGNHENFPAIYSYPVEDWQGGKVHRIRKNILHLMRGEIFEIEGKTFFVMGGAYSIDKYMRTEGVSWWKEETPTDPEFRNASKHLEEHGFKVDYILTHTLPYEIIRRWGINPDDHDRELTGYLDWVMYETNFKHWYCGHWHDDADIFDKFTVLWYDVRKVE